MPLRRLAEAARARHPARQASWRRRTCGAFAALALCAFAFVASGCTGDGSDDPTRIGGLGESLKDVQRLAREEGELRLVAWPGYVRRPWVGPFERQTGCTVTVSVVERSEELVRLLRSGDYDGVAASGDVSGQLMEEGDVAPIDVPLVPGYAHVYDTLKNRPHNTRQGRPYGVPHTRTAHLLVYRTGVVPATGSSNVIWEHAASFSGKIALHDGAMTIAEAALYLKRARPELRIEDPYQLEPRQFRAAVRVVRRQARHVGRFWRVPTAAHVRWYVGGTTVVGTTAARTLRQLEELNAPVEAVKPAEGATGRSDTWMVYSDADNPNCMYLWMDYVISPEAQARIAESFGEAPVNPTACELTRNPAHCAATHAGDEEWWKDIYVWTTPAADCADPARRATCKTLEEWQAAWERIRRARR